jgi:hypothetical protein
MLKEHGVNVVTARLDLKNGVVMDGGRIQKIRSEDGREFAGKMFIDATYEGDLLPGAGVSFTVGRESNATYDEAVYEILFRAIEAGQKKRFMKFSLTPNRKTDSNNDSGISNDYIGANYGKDWNWSTLSHDERLTLAKKHEHWQRGLMWTLQN